MLRCLSICRPLAVLDTETTGPDAKNDRIVEISILRLGSDRRHEIRTRRCNPGIPISPGATEKHKITDTDVAHLPGFESVAGEVVEFLDGCDLAGYNVLGFDLPLLLLELARVGAVLPLGGRKVIDVMKMYQAREKRDLEAAVRFYLARDHVGAHGAEADVRATLAVLDALVGRYPDLPMALDELHAVFHDPTCADLAGRFKRVDGQFVFTFGKHQGLSIERVAAEDAKYLKWMLEADFFDDAKEIVRGALSRCRSH